MIIHHSTEWVKQKSPKAHTKEMLSDLLESSLRRTLSDMVSLEAWELEAVRMDE